MDSKLHCETNGYCKSIDKTVYSKCLIDYLLTTSSDIKLKYSSKSTGSRDRKIFESFCISNSFFEIDLNICTQIIISMLNSFIETDHIIIIISMLNSYIETDHIISI